MNAKGYAKMLTLVAACTLLFAALVGCSSQSNSDKYALVKEGTLSVGSSLDTAPFEAVEGGVPAGYSIAVIQEVANRLGLACEVSNANSSTIISALSAGQQYDVGVASFVIGSKNEEKVDFSLPYYFVDQAIVVLEGTYSQSEEIKDTKVAALSGTASFDYAQEHLTKSLVSYDDIAKCFEALRAGSVSAIVVDMPIAQRFIAAYPDCVILEEIATNDAYGIAVSKDNRTLTDAINEVLREMESDGTIDALQKQYGV